MKFVMLVRPPRSFYWKAILLFTWVSALLIAADWFSVALGLHGHYRVMDDLLGGIGAASCLCLYERHKRRQLRKQQHVIHLMNHHVRNALQPVMFLSYELDEEAQRKHVEESIRRIDWALREVLPGNFSQSNICQAYGGGMKRDPTGWAADAASSPEAVHDRSEPERNHVNPSFRKWLDTWRNQNGAAAPGRYKSQQAREPRRNLADDADVA